MPERKGLSLDGLPDESAPRHSARAPLKAPEPAAQSWESREPMRESQINIRGSSETLTRFKQLCKDDRRTYIAMLEILMDAHERSR